MMQSDPSPAIAEALLRRYLDGTCTPEDEQTVVRWARTHALGGALVRGLRGDTADVWREDAAAVWARIQDSIGRDVTSKLGAESGRRTGTGHVTRARFGTGRMTRPATLWWGGGLLVAIAGVASVSLHHGTASIGPSGHSYATTTGQRAVLALPGGGRVTLAPRSTLQVPDDFGVRDRAVLLTGEAYFEVPHNPGAPFVVQVGDVRARVLGTAFAVRRYAGDATARVVVTEGKVAVSGTRGRRAPVTLTAGLGAEVTDSGTTGPAIASDNDATEWASGRLVFHDAPLPAVLETLTRWYGYEFRLSDSALARRSLTLIASTDSSAATLAALKLVLNVDLRFDGNVITLAPRAAHRALPLRRGEGEAFHHTREVGR